MGSVSHIDDNNKEIVKDVHNRLVDTQSWGVLVHSSSETSFVIDVRASLHLDQVLMELNDSIFSKHNESFFLGGCVLRY